RGTMPCIAPPSSEKRDRTTVRTLTPKAPDVMVPSLQPPSPASAPMPPVPDELLAPPVPVLEAELLLELVVELLLALELLALELLELDMEELELLVGLLVELVELVDAPPWPPMPPPPTPVPPPAPVVIPVF